MSFFRNTGRQRVGFLSFIIFPHCDHKRVCSFQLRENIERNRFIVRHFNRDFLYAVHPCSIQLQTGKVFCPLVHIANIRQRRVDTPYELVSFFVPHNRVKEFSAFCIVLVFFGSLFSHIVAIQDNRVFPFQKILSVNVGAENILVFYLFAGHLTVRIISRNFYTQFGHLTSYISLSHCWNDTKYVLSFLNSSKACIALTTFVHCLFSLFYFCFYIFN